MKYYVEAIRYQREPDGLLLTADKRVHTGLSHSEADKLYKHYLRETDGYWHSLRMTLEEESEEENINRQIDEWLDGTAEGATL